MALRDDVPTANDGTYGALLYGGGFFESVRVDSAEEGGLEGHGVEGGTGGGVVVVGGTAISGGRGGVGAVSASVFVFVAAMAAAVGVAVRVVVGDAIAVSIASVVARVFFVVGGAVAVAMASRGTLGFVLWHGWRRISTGWKAELQGVLTCISPKDPVWRYVGDYRAIVEFGTTYRVAVEIFSNEWSASLVLWVMGHGTDLRPTLVKMVGVKPSPRFRKNPSTPHHPSRRPLVPLPWEPAKKPKPVERNE